MTDLLLTIIGRDRSGIVAALADVVRFHDGDWKRSELAEIAGTFAGVVVVGIADERVDALLTSLVILRESGVHVTVQPAVGPTQVPSDVDIRIRLTGEDRPGVVQQISSALSDRGVSITRMGTVTGLVDNGATDRFEFTAQLSVPVELGIDAVTESLNETAAELGITVQVDDITGDDAS